MGEESVSNAGQTEAGSGSGEKNADPTLCFVIMPISDHKDYPKGHFLRVYQDIIGPACRMAGFEPIRADDIKQSNLIHLDMLERILEAPMALCDLSSRNPNVLFELGLRQAFDKPVALIREVGTPDIFDIGPLRYTEYRKERVYNEVIEDQQSIADAIRDTSVAHANGDGVNSIVKLLSLGKAALPNVAGGSVNAELNRVILSEIEQMRRDMRQLKLAVPGQAHRTLPRNVNDNLSPNARRRRFAELEMTISATRSIMLANRDCNQNVVNEEVIEAMKLARWLVSDLATCVLDDDERARLRDLHLQLEQLSDRKLDPAHSQHGTGHVSHRHG